MNKLVAVSALLGGLFLAPLSAQAHCDSVDGPVARVAIRALETGNVNIVLPYAPAAAEAEIREVFGQVRRVRHRDVDVRHLADRLFMETVVRLHREGENAPYTGLKRAGIDHGPVIPAAEKALETGESAPLLSLLTNGIRHQLQKRFEHSRAARALPREPDSYVDVAAARERVHAELGFVGYAESLHQALKGQASHGEGSHAD